MFQGRFEHSIDEKGRVAIPAPFRKRLQSSDANALVITLSDQCLAAFTPDEWQQKLDIISKLNQLDPNVVAFKRIFVGLAQECPIDKGGRVLIPADLRKQVHIDKNCIVLGQIEKFEIWSEDLWHSNFSQMSDQLSSICSKLSEHGVSL
jgi:MraZ protein